MNAIEKEVTDRDKKDAKPIHIRIREKEVLEY